MLQHAHYPAVELVHASAHWHRDWLGAPRLIVPVQDLAGGAAVDRRGPALGGALAAEFGSVREYCTRFEPLLLQEARAVRARYASCFVYVCCFRRATCDP